MPAVLRRMTILICALVAVMARTDARAQDHVPVDDMGKFLGHTVLCGCLAQEPDHLMALYYALLVEWEDETYAGSASGYMELARDGDYRNKATFCSIICDHEFTTYLTDVVSMIDMETEPDDFVASYRFYRGEHDSAGAGSGLEGAGLYEWNPVWSPGPRSCADAANGEDCVKDSAKLEVDSESVVGSGSDNDARLPACSATEDLYPGVTCDGRRRSRINGY